MRGYLAGPMTGYPQFNFPAFDAAAARLRALGRDVISPAELDDPEVRRRSLGSTHGREVGYGAEYQDYLARDIAIINRDDIEVIWVIDGWEKSRGARIETFVHYGLNHKPILYADTERPVPHALIMAAWDPVCQEGGDILTHQGGTSAIGACTAPEALVQVYETRDPQGVSHYWCCDSCGACSPHTPDRDRAFASAHLHTTAH